MNLIGTPEDLSKTTTYLKEFKIKDLGKTELCLGLELQHKENGILIHQSAYTRKVLKRFNMDKSHPMSTSMVIRSLEPKKDLF